MMSSGNPALSRRLGYSLLFLIHSHVTEESYNNRDFENKIWAPFLCCLGRLFYAAASPVRKTDFLKPASSLYKPTYAVNGKLLCFSKGNQSLLLSTSPLPSIPSPPIPPMDLKVCAFPFFQLLFLYLCWSSHLWLRDDAHIYSLWTTESSNLFLWTFVGRVVLTGNFWTKGFDCTPKCSTQSVWTLGVHFRQTPVKSQDLCLLLLNDIQINISMFSNVNSQ